MPHISKVQFTQLLWIRGFALAGQASVLLYFYLTISNVDVLLPGALGIIILSLITAASSWQSRRVDAVTDTQLTLQLGIDVVGWSAIMYLTGGANNPFVSYLLVPIIVSAAVLNQRNTILIALAALVAYTLLLRYHQPFGLLAPMGTHEKMQSHTLGMWFNFLFSAALVVTFVTKMAKTMREREVREARYREQRLQDEQIHAIATIAASTAHELGTPLNALSLITDELRHVAQSNTELQDLLNELDQRVDECGLILQTLANKAEFDGLRQQSRITAKEWIEAQLMRWRNKNPGVALTVDTRALTAGIEISVDQTLGAAIENILNNALEAETDRIEVTLNASTLELFIEIRDYGCGLRDEILTQLGTTTLASTTEGLGIGIMLSNATINRHGGILTYHQPAGGGTLARITLPLQSEATE
jgi:two-component system sensor histidine kinase RegB